MKYKHSILIFIFGAFAFAACSSGNVAVKEKKQKKAAKKMNNLAMKFFIEGNTQELKGNLSQAIADYKKALQYDTTAGIYYSLGKAYLRSNKLLPALENAKAAIRLDSTNTEYLILLGNVYSFSHNIDSAEIVFNKVIQMDSTDARAYYNLGILNEFTHPRKALRIFEKLLKITGNDWNVLLKIAEINDALGNVQKTIETLEKLREMNPTDFKLEKLLIVSYLKGGKYDKAAKLINDAMLSHPEDTDLLRIKGEIFIHRKKFKEAEKLFLKIVKQPGVSFKTKFELASSFLQGKFKEKKVQQIGKHLLLAIEKDTADWRVEAMLSELAVSNKNDSAAIKYLNKAVHNAAWNSQLWSRYANLLFTNNKYKKLVEEVEPQLSNFPDNFFLNLMVGLSYSLLNELQKAKKYLLKAVNLNANDATALQALGFTLNQLKENDDAIFYLERSLKIRANNIDVLGLLGLIYDNKKEYEKCDEYYSRAIAIDSNNALILNNYAYSLSERGVKLQQALKMAKKAISEEPANASYLDTYGWVLYKLKFFKKAKKWIEKSVKIDPENSVVLEHLGDVWLKLGNESKALKYWGKALQLDRKNKSLIKKIKEHSK